MLNTIALLAPLCACTPASYDMSDPIDYAWNAPGVARFETLEETPELILENVFWQFDILGWPRRNIPQTTTENGHPFSMRVHVDDHVIDVTPRFYSLSPCKQAAVVRHELHHVECVEEIGQRGYGRRLRTDAAWAIAFEAPADCAMLEVLAMCSPHMAELERVAKWNSDERYPELGQSRGLRETEVREWIDITRNIFARRIDDIEHRRAERDVRARTWHALNPQIYWFWN